MRRLIRALILTGIVLGALLVVLTGTVVYVVRDSFPSYGGNASLPGLDADVEVIRDGNGIAQIYANSAADLFAAQGYVPAQDRFFEMDFRRNLGVWRRAVAVLPDPGRGGSVDRADLVPAVRAGRSVRRDRPGIRPQL